MTCAKCGVEVAAESAYAGTWCARCGEKEEERLGKLLDEPSPGVAPDQALTEGELARAKESLTFLTVGLPPEVKPGATTYEEVKQEWETEAGKAISALKKRRK